jgi:hypothetical protein
MQDEARYIPLQPLLSPPTAGAFLLFVALLYRFTPAAVATMADAAVVAAPHYTEGFVSFFRQCMIRQLLEATSVMHCV